MNNVVNEILAMKVMGYKDASGFKPMEKIEHAWAIVEKMRDRNLGVLVRNHEKGYFSNAYKTVGNTDVNYYTVAPTAPVAICLSVCRLLGVDVDIYSHNEEIQLSSQEVTLS